MTNPNDKPAFDPVRFKEQERVGFNLVADRYEIAMSQMMSPVITHLLTLADVRPGLAFLDVATGPGLVARAIARGIGNGNRVVGIDIAENALALARQKAEAAGLNDLSFQVEDAEKMSFEEATFDRVICSLGLMHFPDPAAALAEMYRVLKPNGGRLVAVVWSEAHDAPFIEVALSTLGRVFPPPKIERPSMFRFGQPAVLEKLVADAGFQEIKSERAVIELSVPDAAAYWKQFLDVAGITTVALAKQPPEMMERLEKESLTDLAPYKKEQGYDLSSGLMLVTGLKS